MAVPKEMVARKEVVVVLMQAVGHRIASVRARSEAYRATHGLIHPQCARLSPRMKTGEENTMQMIHAASAGFWSADTPSRSKKERLLDASGRFSRCRAAVARGNEVRAAPKARH